MKTLPSALQIHVLGLANGYVGYVPTAKASAEGGYATDIGSGAYFTEHAEDLIAKEAGELLKTLA